MLQGQLESRNLHYHQPDHLDLNQGEPEAGGRILVRRSQLKGPSTVPGTEQALDNGHCLPPSCLLASGAFHYTSLPLETTPWHLSIESPRSINANVLTGLAITFFHYWPPVLSSNRFLIITHDKGLSVYYP